MTTTTSTSSGSPRRSPLPDDVYESTKTLLMDLAIEPGARVSIEGLARDFGVSPTPVREALARLESDGLVVKEPLKGYRATPLLTRAELDDLYAFRQLIEPWAARRAAERIDPDGIRALEDELASATTPASLDYRGYRAFSQHDQRFHSLIAEMAGSDQVRAALERTHCHLHIFRLSLHSDSGPVALAEHRSIAAALIHGNPDAAAKAMSEHLSTSRRERVTPR